MILDANSEFLSLVGLTKPELLHHSARELGLWACAGDWERLNDLLRVQCAVHEMETQFRTNDGESCPVRLDARLIHWSNEPCALMVAQDVTVQNQASQALQRSEALKRSILETAPDAVITFDRHGRVLDFNAAAEKTLGYLREQALHRPWTSIVFPGMPENPESKTPAEAAPGSDADRYSGRMEVTAKRGDGCAFPAELIVTVAGPPGQPVYTAWLRDISARRQLETQLWHSQKLEAVGRLAGGVAHDFNNLLTVITGYSDMLLDTLPHGDPRRQHVEEIRKAGDRASALTRQLLAFSRRQVLAPQQIDLNAIVSNLDRMLRRLIGEDVEVRNVLVPGLWSVKADPGQIEQVLVNLAVNARDAMPQGGTLTIETSNVTLTPQQGMRYNPHMPPGEYVMLVVSDTGCGMDAKTQELIFEPFFTTKEEGKGTGLGLATVYGIIKQSGGYIWVESQTGAGAAFAIYLPRVAGSVAMQGTAMPRAPRATGSETILLVEDEDAVRRLVRGTLKSAGYGVLEASRGEDAVQTALSHKQPIHLLLTDVVMPHIGGRELAGMIEVLDPSIKVLFMSGYPEEAFLEQGVFEPGLSIIQKPFTPEALLRKVKEVLDRPGSPRARRRLA